MKTKHIFYCIFGVLMFAACLGGDYERQLERFEEMNRTDVPLCVDSVQPLVRHYDHWWHSPNHRMRAYYMLGCAYRDQGEAPAAIHYYNIAAEQADTASSECDYATLFRVYGQMATIYGRQDMPTEKKEALLHYKHYAWLAHDTLNYIIGYAHMSDVCYQMDDIAGVFAYTDSAYILCKKYGFNEMATQVYPTAIYVSLTRGEYEKAKSYMDIFENQSGLFDADGNIRSGKEHYYYSKGLYYAGVGDLDSAEYYFRRLISYGHYYEAYKGLLSVYASKEKTDSIGKYVELAEYALGQWMGSQQTNNIIRSSAMYRYERNQNLALANAHRATRFRLLWIIMMMLSVLLFSIVFIIFRQHNKKQEMKLRLLNENLMKAKKEREQLLEEYHILKSTYDNSETSIEAKKLLAKKQARIEELEIQLGKYQEDVFTLNYAQREKLLKENEISIYLTRKTRITPNWKPPREEK